MTVSNVINNNKSRVSQETFDKVSQIIKELDYVPNANARSLIRNQAQIVALYIPSYNGKSLLDNAYNSFIVGAVEEYVQKYDFNLMLISNPNIDEVSTSLASWSISGLIALSIRDEDVKQLESKLKIPIVLLDSYYHSSKTYSVGTSDYEGGRLAGKYLTELGHRNLAMASGPELLDINELKKNKVLYNRYLGFLQGIEETGLSESDIKLFGKDISYEGGISIGKQLGTKKNISAIFCTSDALAAGVIEGAKKVGIITPKDLSVIGFDDLPISQYITPRLTTIHQKNREKGEFAVEILMKAMKNQKTQCLQLNVELVERNSTLPFY